MSSNPASAIKKQWYINEEGDITDGAVIIAEPNYLTAVSYKTAHLLAAAPELLAACEHMMKILDDADRYRDSVEVDARRMMFKAINKAKGAGQRTETHLTLKIMKTALTVDIRQGAKI